MRRRRRAEGGARGVVVVVAGDPGDPGAGPGVHEESITRDGPLGNPFRCPPAGQRASRAGACRLHEAWLGARRLRAGDLMNMSVAAPGNAPAPGWAGRTAGAAHAALAALARRVPPGTRVVRLYCSPACYAELLSDPSRHSRPLCHGEALVPFLQGLLDR